MQDVYGLYIDADTGTKKKNFLLWVQAIVF